MKLERVRAVLCAGDCLARLFCMRRPAHDKSPTTKVAGPLLGSGLQCTHATRFRRRQPRPKRATAPSDQRVRVDGSGTGRTLVGEPLPKNVVVV